MIVVDTSVWIAGFRGHEPVALELSRLLDSDRAALVSPVRLELLEGSRRAELGRLRRLLGAVPTFVPAANEWMRVEDWIALASKRGQRFAVMDLLIGAVATEHGASVWSLDHDFERMAKLRFIRLHRGAR